MPHKPARRTVSAKNKYHVFISHSTTDLFIAKVMAEKIKAAGAQVWLDVQNLEGGAPLKAQIIEGMRTCKEAIVLVSPKSVESAWVTYETGLAEGRRLRVTPILINVAYDANPVLKDLKAIDINSFDEYLEQLKRRIRTFRQNRRGA